jgi:cell wall-associated NlpC family hydrolase
VVVTSVEERKVYADTLARVVVSDIVDGDILESQSAVGGWVDVVLPDGRCGWVRRSDVTPIEQWASQPLSADTIIAVAARHIGTPYTWGGNSSKGMDCSGLVKMAFLHCGVIVRRDASQQAQWGREVAPDSLQPGDLVFYGNQTTGHVDHVAIYVGGDRIIESSGLVKYSTPAVGNRYLLSRRVVGEPESEGIVEVRHHPWYGVLKVID